MKTKVIIATRVDPSVQKKLLQAAKREGLSIADYVRRLILRDLDLCA